MVQNDALPARPIPAAYDGASPLQGRSGPAEPESAVILDGVMYLDEMPRAGTHSAAGTAQGHARPGAWKLGIIPRRINSPRYY